MASRFIQASMSTSPVSYCCAIAGTSPSALNRTRASNESVVSSGIAVYVCLMMAKAKTDGVFLERTQALLARADELCARRGVRLTDLRRQVLGTILDAGSPVGAYDILNRLRVFRPGATPPSVYRTLDFLLSQGFVHRLERLSAFVGCLAREGEDHSAQFLICRNCGKVLELEDSAVNEALMRAARHVGFAMRHATVEAEGICQACAVLKPAAGVKRRVRDQRSDRSDLPARYGSGQQARLRGAAPRCGESCRWSAVRGFRSRPKRRRCRRVPRSRSFLSWSLLQYRAGKPLRTSCMRRYSRAARWHGPAHRATRDTAPGKLRPAWRASGLP